MSASQDTRSSLIARLTSVGDDDSWREFAAIYEPLIYRQGRRYGLQHADARELVQEVLVAVSKGLERFQVDRQRGRFRTWLYALGRNIAIRHMQRLRRVDRATGDSGIRAAISAAPDPRSCEPDDFDLELKRHAFLFVAREVRHQFQPRTWRAFWKTAVENHSVRSTATALGMSVGAVYIARTRVMARLRQRIQEITLEGIRDRLEISRRIEAEERTT